jgi:hypothetical protein
MMKSTLGRGGGAPRYSRAVARNGKTRRRKMTMDSNLIGAGRFGSGTNGHRHSTRGKNPPVPGSVTPAVRSPQEVRA